MTEHRVFAAVRDAEGEFLALDDYQAESDEVYGAAQGEVWKLERAQHFHEPSVPSWLAADEGDWPRALDVI
ncbi:hypothetical protein GCM10009530_20840 [Microbispora corallina]|uniref:Uncharacterized protein n=1 Tax=Microbispora corallina TaxID=83302 RepID=A0ABQ4FU05_9ACTN|nr:hypothetical protein [Microbispora corallina]GIH38256.1 hypothetical protein Mco01_12560 [Microbispora corallina]